MDKINIEKLFKQIIVNSASEQDIFNFLNNLNSIYNKDNALLIFKILYLLKLNKNLSPLLILSVDSCFNNLFFEENQNQKIEVKKQYSIDLTKSLREQFNNIKDYRSFPPSENPDLKYPKKGDNLILYYTEEDLIPNKKFKCTVLIDSDGNIVEFVNDPIEIYDEIDYETIYAGLAGKLFELDKE